MLNTIDRTSPIPLHYQLKQVLLEKIEAGEWQSDDLIPSEQELQDTFGISRTTVRQTLSELVFEGRLVRERGRGTFVARPKMTHSPREHMSLTETLKAQGIEPGWRVLETAWVSPDKNVREQLQLEGHVRVFRIRRVRLAADEPIGYHIAYLPEVVANQVIGNQVIGNQVIGNQVIGNQINTDTLETGGSLNYLSGLALMHESKANRTIEAVAAEETEAELLEIEPGCPILLISRVTVSKSGMPIEFMQASYRGDRFKYQISD